MKTIIKLIGEWLNTNTDKSKAKQDLIKVVDYLQTIASQADNIANGTSVIPAVNVELPSWATKLEADLTALCEIDPTLIAGAVKKMLEEVTNILTELTNEIEKTNTVPVTPISSQTPSQIALNTNLANIAEAANNTLKIAPSASNNISAIQKWIAEAKQNIEKLILEIKAKV